MKEVSLRWELMELSRAIDAMSLLSEMLVNGPANVDDEKLVLPAMDAVGNLIRTRLVLVDAVLRGEVDPSMLLAEFNQVIGGGGEGPPLRPWSNKERAKRLRVEADRLDGKRRRRRKKPESPS